MVNYLRKNFSTLEDAEEECGLSVDGYLGVSKLPDSDQELENVHPDTLKQLDFLSRKQLVAVAVKALKCHWDQNFGIPYFCIFENSLWLLVTMPNFNSLRLEVAFFGRFLSRFYGRHY